MRVEVQFRISPNICKTSQDRYSTGFYGALCHGPDTIRSHPEQPTVTLVVRGLQEEVLALPTNTFPQGSPFIMPTIANVQEPSSGLKTQTPPTKAVEQGLLLAGDASDSSLPSQLVNDDNELRYPIFLVGKDTDLSGTERGVGKRNGNLGLAMLMQHNGIMSGDQPLRFDESSKSRSPKLVSDRTMLVVDHPGSQDPHTQSSCERLITNRAAVTSNVQQSNLDLGPISIGLYPSKDPTIGTSVVIFTGDRVRHRPSFDDSATVDSTSFAQIDSHPELLRAGGSSSVSLASSSNCSAVFPRQLSLQRIATPPTTLSGTHSDFTEAPIQITDHTTKTRDGFVNFETLRSGNFPVLYSAIGSLEDPKNLGVSWRKYGASSKIVHKRDFPSVVNTAERASGSTRRSKSKAHEVSRRSSFGDENNSTTPDGDADQTPAISNTRKQANKMPVNDSEKPKRSKRKEMFRPSSDAYTPRIDNYKKVIKYKPAESRTPVMAGSMGTLHRPNYSDALRRVAMIIRQHIVKIETRFEDESSVVRRGHKCTDKLFSKSMEDLFVEEKFMIPRYRCTMVRVPMAITGMACGLKKIKETYSVPTEAEIYEFAHRLFKTVQLSSECSIVSLIYIERLMETSKVPLLASTWRPVFMCGLLMASKVWQDLSTWNVEFSSVYPQYSLENINKLELQFLRMIKWDLYISSSLYAKYYFALRSLEGKHDFRQRYNHMVGGDSVRPQQARQIEERSLQVKEEALLQLSRSM